MKKHAAYIPLVRKQKITKSIYEYVFSSPEIAAHAKPGQFVQIRTSDDYFPLWPRPFSIYDVDRAEGEFAIAFKIFGCGTSQLAAYAEGDKVQIHGPLGNGFAPMAREDKIIMVAGGVGLPPLYFLARETINSGYSAKKIVFISGARSKEEHFGGGKLAELGTDLRICTDDGSSGEKGTSVDLFEKIINGDNDIVYACGPTPMLAKLDSIMQNKNMRGYLSLETLMPCGMGICSGCAVKTKPSPNRGPTDDKRDYHLQRVCVDGPVFESGKVIWE